MPFENLERDKHFYTIFLLFGVVQVRIEGIADLIWISLFGETKAEIFRRHLFVDYLHIRITLRPFPVPSSLYRETIRLLVLDLSFPHPAKRRVTLPIHPMIAVQHINNRSFKRITKGML